MKALPAMLAALALMAGVGLKAQAVTVEKACDGVIDSRGNCIHTSKHPAKASSSTSKKTSAAPSSSKKGGGTGAASKSSTSSASTSAGATTPAAAATNSQSLQNGASSLGCPKGFTKNSDGRCVAAKP